MVAMKRVEIEALFRQRHGRRHRNRLGLPHFGRQIGDVDLRRARR